MPIINPSVTDPSQFSASYWNGACSRKELQAILEEYAKTFQAFAVAHEKLDIVVGFLIEDYCTRTNITPDVALEQVKAFAESKAKEFVAVNKDASFKKLSVEESVS